MKDEQRFQIRTDLAIEAREMFVEEEKQTEDIEGVILTEKKIKGFPVTDVQVDEIGQENINKQAGRYLTLETDAVKNSDSDQQQVTAEVLSHILADLLTDNQISPDAKCLVVGLGNDYVTPDALGPQTIKKILVTKHLVFLLFQLVYQLLLMRSRLRVIRLIMCLSILGENLKKKINPQKVLYLPR